MFKQIGASLACAAMLSACVSNPDNIAASYVNPSPFKTMACTEVQGELQRVSAKEADLSGRQRANFHTDAALLTVGMLVFWPALLAMPATTDRKGEIAQLRGEKEALERAASSQCAEPVMAGQPATTTASGTAAVTSAAAVAELQPIASASR